MSNFAGRHDHDLDGLMQGLVADLQPVKPLRPWWLRLLTWAGLILTVAVSLAFFADMAAFRDHLMSATDMWLAAAGSALTTILAAVAAFQVSLPDRSRAWALLPLPGLALWITASGLGCARTWFIPMTYDNWLGEMQHCFAFILGFSIPLSAILFVMLRRGYSFSPALTGALAGLAVAAAAATLLSFFHPVDEPVTDLAIHALAVSLVILANGYLAGRYLRQRTSRE